MKQAFLTSSLLQNVTMQATIPLKDKNWFRTGGTAHLYAEPTTAEQMQATLAYAHEHHLPLFMLGSGANILISDDGFNGLVIKPALATVSHQFVDSACTHVTAGAGVTMDALIEYCLNHHLLGLEEFSGIPGTVGGSVYINLHYFEFSLAQFLVTAQIVDKHGTHIDTVDASWFDFGYDMSKLHHKEHFLVNATFALTKGTKLQTAFAHGKRAEIIRHRAKRYPTTHTCGSFFRNFLSHEVHLESNGKKVIWAAYYLDKVGIKGVLHYGDAIVSHQHANMIVNTGNATSQDIIMLARAMQQAVFDQFNIMLQPECQFIGFKEYPLFI